jgi:hypothetical protein
MNITYTLTQDEYQKAVTIHLNRGNRLVMLAIYVALAVGIVLLGTDFTNTREVITNILAVFFSVAFYMLFVRMISAYQAKSIYKKSPALQHEVTLRVSGKGITLDKKTNNATIPWKAFTKWKEDENFYLLYTGPRQFNVIPKHALNETQRKELDAYLEKYIF